MDGCEMGTLPDQSFTFAIDKGCIDALFCQSNYSSAIKRMLCEINRILKPDGVFACISHGNARARVPYFRSVPMGLDVLPLLEGEGLTLFVLTRTTDPAALEKKIVGAEASVRALREKRVVTSLDHSINRSAAFKEKQNAGKLTVTASDQALADLVSESAEVDG
jgi:hypothetical protein